jgi:hypothetical protein
MKQVLMALTVTLLPALAHSATFYVAKTGSDGYSCSQAQSPTTPKLTIAGPSGGLKCLSAGSTLIIKGGAYAEAIDNGQIPSGSSWDAATVVRAAPGETVILQPTSGGGGGDAVWFYGQSYIVLDGLIIDASNVPVQGVRINDNNGSPSHHIRLQNVEVMNAHQSNCIGVQNEKQHDLQFINVKAHHCGNNTSYHHGLYLKGSNNLVDRSQFYNNAGEGVQLYGSITGNSNNTIRNSVMHDNGSVGLMLGSGSNNVAYNNQVYINSRASFGGGIYINYTGATNNQVYNNTVYGNNGYCVYVGSDSTGAIVQNNVCWQNATNSIKNDGSKSSIANNLTADPKFTDAGNKDFRLQVGSPAIDAGVKISAVGTDFAGMARPQGAAYDLGAYEFKLTLTPPINVTINK